MQAFPPPQGLYDGPHEHDACGVAFVATLTGVASHDIVGQGPHRPAQPRAPRCRGRRAQLRRRRRDPDAGPRRASSATVVDFDLPADSTPTPSAPPSSPATTSRSPRPAGASRRSPPRRASPSSAGATSRPTRPRSAQTALRLHAVLRPAVRRRRAAAGSSGMALERLAFCLRKRAERETDVYFPSLSSRTIAYKGMLTTDQLDHVFPDLVDERVESRHRGRALALLHQHLPELAAVAPVPVHRAQRRDQHRDGQPQLDAGPRGAAQVRPDPRRPRAALPDLHARARATPRPSTRCSSCCTSAAAACPTRC